MKYTLKWSGRKDSEVVQLAFAYCKKEIPICKDTCEFINYDRYVELVAASELDLPSRYSTINEGEVGMICWSDYAREHRLSWELLDQCYKDFMTGYAACETKYKHLRDWDEAIEYNTRLTKYLSKLKRSISFKVKDNDDSYYPHTVAYRMSNGTWKFTITDNCTGPEFEYLVYTVCSDCKIPMPTLELDPRR